MKFWAFLTQEMSDSAIIHSTYNYTVLCYCYIVAVGAIHFVGGNSVWGAGEISVPPSPHETLTIGGHYFADAETTH